MARASAWWRPRAKVAAATSTEPEETRTTFAFNALCGFIFILLVAPQEQLTFLSPLHLAVLTAVLAAGSLIYERAKARRQLFARSSAVTVSFVLVAWTLISIPFSMWPGGSFGLFTGIYFKSIIIFLLLGTVVDSGLALKRMALAMTLFALPVAFTAILHFAHHTVVGGEQAVDRIVGYQSGLSQNPNDLALILNLILPLAIALFFSAKKTLHKVLFALAVGIDAAAVVATFSRAGFLTLFAVFLGFTWKMRNRPQRIYLFAAWGFALVAAVAVLPAGYLSHLGTITNIKSDATGSAQERSRDMIAALGVIGQHPIFGAGLGQNVLALNKARGVTWRMVHNVYLQYAADLGLPGLLIFLALFKSCWSDLSAALRSLRGDPARGDLLFLADGVQLSLVGFALAGFFHPAGYNFDFFLFAGLAVAVRQITLRSVQHA